MRAFLGSFQELSPCMCMCVHVYVYVCAYVYVCTYVCMCVHVCLYVCACLYVCKCVRVYVPLSVYAYELCSIYGNEINRSHDSEVQRPSTKLTSVTAVMSIVTNRCRGSHYVIPISPLQDTAKTNLDALRTHMQFCVHGVTAACGRLYELACIHTC